MTLYIVSTFSLQGEIFWKGDMTEARFSAAPFTPSNTTGKMLYLWVSDYVINTIAYVANKHGQLRYNLTSKDVSKFYIFRNSVSQIE